MSAAIVLGLVMLAAGTVVLVGGENPAETLMMPMSDGVRLHTQVWKPTHSGPWPVVLQRGYWSGNEKDAARFVNAGYAYVGQSTRGHGESEGENNRFFDDAKDGSDTLDWIAEQPWCDGQIAMYGKSYMAMTQWLVARDRHPNLKAIIPQNGPLEIWKQGYWSNGAFSLAMAATGRVFDQSRSDYDYERLLRHLPLIELDQVVSGQENKLWNEYVTHSTFDAYWQTLSVKDRLDQIDIPVFLMAGWYDYYPGAAFEAYETLVANHRGNDVRIVVSATDHLNRIAGDRDFSGGGKDEIALAIRWLDFVLRGIENGVGDEPPVQLFVMGENRWRFENEWPLQSTQFTKFYFQGNESRHGTLSQSVPTGSTSTRYEYDPADPTPTLGGNHSCLLNAPELIRAGAVDQRPNEARDDVLIFTSEPMTVDTEVTGPVTVTLYASTTATDTDFIARLIDVHPDGTAYNLTEGIVRARFRKNIFQPPEPIEPGKVIEYTIELLPTSNVFFKGHRIRIHLTSSCFPLWDRNLNTGERQGYESQFRSATQRIFHSTEFPSHVVLPLISAAAHSKHEDPSS